MKIYTKTGDKGKTSLLGGLRVDKDDLRIEAYGTVDELNSYISLIYSKPLAAGFADQLLNIQNNLFTIGSILASKDYQYSTTQLAISPSSITKLENSIDMMNEELPQLKNFILPGGNIANSYCHICRTVCRRAERRVITLSKSNDIPNEIIIYLNRLSDYFFVLARYISYSSNSEEIKWNAD